MAKKSAKANVTYFDLDAVAQQEVVIKLFGNEYPLVPVTVETFVLNTKMIEAQKEVDETDLEARLDFTRRMLLQAFPSMTADVFNKMTMAQMNKLVELAHKLNGQNQGEEKLADEAQTAPNPPTAG